MLATRKDRFDVVVVGSGLGGLTAAALLAKEGREVLVLEKESTAGGYAAGFEWKGRRFDQALHLIMGAGRPSESGEGIVTGVLAELGVTNRCELVRADPFYRAVFPGLDVTVSGRGREGFVASHRHHFPARASALEDLLATCAEIHTETLRFPIAPRLWQTLLVPLRFPRLFRNLDTTLEEVLDRHGFDGDAKAVLGALWLYLGLPPSRLSFPVWAAMTASMVDEGAFYCLGGFGRLADAFRDGVERHGGEVRTGKPVRKIRVEHGAAQGVETNDGEIYRAPVVISNIDARLTTRDLVGDEHFPPDYRDRIAALAPSVFVVALYTAVPRDRIPEEVVHETIVFASRDHDGMYEDGLAGRISSVTVTIPTITDSSVAPAGEHLVVLKAMIPGTSPSAPHDAPRQLAECASAVLPSLHDHLCVGPDAPQGNTDRYALKTLGPIYGWERSPSQVGPRGLGNTTPIQGLYLCGHWSQPGAGVRTVVTSGMRVSRLILGNRTSKGLIS